MGPGQDEESFGKWDTKLGPVPSAGAPRMIGQSPERPQHPERLERHERPSVFPVQLYYESASPCHIDLAARHYHIS